jgi:TPR repeat protein
MSKSAPRRVWIAALTACGLGLATDDARAQAGVALLETTQSRAEAGDTQAMMSLGLHYLGRLPLTENRSMPDPNQGVRWLSRAAEGGHAAAACALALHWRAAGDLVAAERWTDQAADRGDPACMLARGLALAGNETMSADTRAAFTWVDKAAQAGLEMARYQRADWLARGFGTKAAPEAALRAFRELAASGMSPALVRICVLTGSHQEALDACRKGAAAGQVAAMHRLALMLANDGDRRGDDQEARRWCLRAADAGDADSMMCLAQMLDRGRGGGRNPAQAARWALRGLRGGSADASVLVERPHDWSASFWRALQQGLREEGRYRGPLDGQMNIETAQAIVSAFAPASASTPATASKPAVSPIGAWRGCDGRIVTFARDGSGIYGRYTALGGLGRFGFELGEISHRLRADSDGDGGYSGEVKWRHVDGQMRWAPTRITIFDGVLTDSGADSCARTLQPVR